ncbi:MAG: TonB-dependent receptor plug domain-containing protein, partial [Alphaproteobacteria bacterium]
MTRTIARLAAGAFAWAAVAAPGPAFAQTAADPDARSETETESAAGPVGGEAAPSGARARAGTDFFMDQISVIATRNEKQILDVPANVTVISGEKIERRMITDMQELIRHEPGIDVDRQTSATDPFNSFGGFTIRGVGDNRVQMVVDGSRVPERITDGTRDFLDLDFIKQAEIVRGPGSVLWGSDALGGVVALQTIDPEDMIDPATGFGGRVSGAYDSFNNGVDTSATLAGQLHPKVAALLGVSYDVSEEGELSRARADGGIYGCPRNLADGATPCDELDPTDETSRRALGKLVLTPAEDHRIELSADYLDRDTEVRFDQALGPQFSTTTGLPTGEIVDARVQERDLKRQRYAVEHSWDVGASFLDRLRWTAAYAPQG